MIHQSWGDPAKRGERDGDETSNEISAVTNERREKARRKKGNALSAHCSDQMIRF